MIIYKAVLKIQGRRKLFYGVYRGGGCKGGEELSKIGKGGEELSKITGHLFVHTFQLASSELFS